MTYGSDFASVFQSAGWKFGGYTGSVAPPEIDSVCLAIKAGTPIEKIRPAALALQKALGDLGLTKSAGMCSFAEGLGESDVSITIAPKPLPDQ
jgi:hypothetical protein